VQAYAEPIFVPPATNPNDLRVHVVRNLTPKALAELAHDLLTADQSGDDLEPVIAAWAAIE
jgi:hypothetical protein